MYRIVWKQNGPRNPETGVWSEHETSREAAKAWYRIHPVSLRQQMQLQRETETEWVPASLDSVTREVIEDVGEQEEE